MTNSLHRPSTLEPHPSRFSGSLADSERGPRSGGTIEPERICEVVSDVVESQSGYLDVGFDLPSGAFRVIDVIVTEARRFTQ